MSEEPGKVAIITASSQGIGLATAQVLLRRGIRVVLNGRDSQRLQTAAGILSGLGTPVTWVAGDASQLETVSRLVAEAEAVFGRMDILINNLGGGSTKTPLAGMACTHWADGLARNLTGPFLACRAAIPALQRRGGRIVNVASSAGRAPGRLSGVEYAAAKAGLIGLTRHLAWELGPWGITVNAIAPGIIATQRALAKWAERSDSERAHWLAGIPLGRLGTPDEVAHSIAFLVSDEAAYITGATLDVNGGSYMG